MFQVTESYYGQIRVRKVYAVRTVKNGDIEFLLHINNKWIWDSADGYHPM